MINKIWRGKETTSPAHGQNAGECFWNVRESSQESPSQCWAGGLSSFPFHGQQKGSVKAEPSEEAVNTESHQNDSLSSTSQSPGNWEHIIKAYDTRAWSLSTNHKEEFIYVFKNFYLFIYLLLFV